MPFFCKADITGSLPKIYLGSGFMAKKREAKEKEGLTEKNTSTNYLTLSD